MYCSAMRLFNNLDLSIPPKVFETKETDLQP